ncbi:MAG: tRNA pseudouridine(55) synthase TruB [Candidatus Dojkabacteria bacterium]
MIDGILLINKEEGITSYDVIRKLKRVLPKGQKIGHAGTLDPFATGLLIILLGKATKLMEKIHTLEKGYIVKGEFGYSTDTQDVAGKKIKEVENLKVYSKKEIEKAIKKNLVGKISQMPPMYSAKKIKGQKAYTLARSGQVVDLERKDIIVKKFAISEYLWPFVTFEIFCSTGTYIRTLIDNLGKYLGCYATAITLLRTNIGEFSVMTSINSCDLEEGDIMEKVITLDKIDI